MKAAAMTGAAFLLISAAAAADVTKTEEMSFEVDSGARISVENINGDIEVVGGSGETVHLIAKKKADDQEYLDKLEIEVDANRDYIRIETKHPKSGDGWFSWGGDGGGSVSYRLTVPAHVRLDTVSTVNGDVSIEAVAGSVKAETVNGSLEAKGLTSDVDLETVNGSVLASFDKLGAGQRVSAEAVNGKIVLVLPEDASARLDAETVNGSIDAQDFGLDVEKGFIGRSCSGEFGGGEARIKLETVNGSVKLKKK
jgi:DUF4097 and DUF4098 domain-containing protein YvlB